MTRSRGTVCFIIDNGKVLLAEIVHPSGLVVWNGIGGVMEDGESPAQTVVREVSEETKIILKESDITEVTIVNIGNLELHVLLAHAWSGELQEIDPSLRRLRWFGFAEVPYEKMHPGNDEWLPGILKSAGNSV